MISRIARPTLVAFALCLLATGCRHPRKTTSAPNSADYADNIQALVEKDSLPILRWPNYSDYQPAVQTFYSDRNFEISWLRDGKPTPESTTFIHAFQDAAAKGLNPEDYDASRWPARIKSLTQIDAAHDNSDPAQEAVAQFDTAMTICVMRYVSDLRIGRVNPQHFNFDIDVAGKRYNLAEFVSDNAVDAKDVLALILSVEPDSDLYRATEAALGRYLVLAHQQAVANAPPLPDLRPDLRKFGISIGGFYPATGQLLARLQLEGDAPGLYPLAPAPTAPTTHRKRPFARERRLAANAGRLFHRHATVPPTPAALTPLLFTPPDLPPIYTQQLSDAIKLYQRRHGINDDGKLTSETLQSLNIPLTERVIQLQDSLERWRWLPDQYLNAPLIVNLPEFVLRGYDSPGHTLSFTMRVVVGKVVGEHYTPVFAHMMRYLVFRPYWNVPTDIAAKEIAPHMESNPNYLATHNFEATDAKGNVIPHVTAHQVAHGEVLVREKPGPKNSLGLVKFMFPNQYDIYLHSTPATELFSLTRRDFSHGCVRVQKPEDLAVWVLNFSDTLGPSSPGKPAQPWTLPEVHQTMTSGPDNHQVNLKKPIPIVIFYLTAIQSEDGHTHFFKDLYGYDQKLQQVLAKGPPYPVKPDPAPPKTNPSGTL